MKINSGKRGFTIIEVLVVLAVIAVVAAILSSAIIFGLRAAKVSSCANNLNQLQKGVELYAADNNNYYPEYVLGNETDNVGKKPIANFQFRQGVRPYLGSDEIYKCPADDTYGTTAPCSLLSSRELTSYFGWYGIFCSKQHSYTNGLDVWVDFTESLVQKPSTSCPFVDCGVSDIPTMSENFSVHGDYTNAVYYDGHTKFIPMKDTSCFHDGAQIYPN